LYFMHKTNVLRTDIFFFFQWSQFFTSYIHVSVHMMI
jgi:hypothetical protein